MIIRNYLNAPAKMEECHGGKGEIKNAFVYGEGDFETPLRFLIYTELEPGRSIGYHQHGKNEEMYIILEGTGTMTINGEMAQVTRGDAILNKPGWAHGLENDGSETLKLLVFEVGKA